METQPLVMYVDPDYLLTEINKVYADKLTNPIQRARYDLWVDYYIPTYRLAVAAVSEDTDYVDEEYDSEVLSALFSNFRSMVEASLSVVRTDQLQDDNDRLDFVVAIQQQLAYLYYNSADDLAYLSTKQGFETVSTSLIEKVATPLNYYNIPEEFLMHVHLVTMLVTRETDDYLITNDNITKNAVMLPLSQHIRKNITYLNNLLYFIVECSDGGLFPTAYLMDADITAKNELAVTPA